MLTFAYYLLKVMICSCLLYGHYVVALRNKRFHHYNRWYLLSVVALSFLIPLIRIEFWNEAPQSTAMEVVTIINRADVYVAEKASSFNWDTVGIACFVLISFIFLLSLIVSLVKIFILIKKSPTKFWKNIYFVFSNSAGTPFSFFQYIFWNNEIDIDIESNTGKHILNHELAHVYEKHSADKLFLNLMLIIGWYNPFLWLVRKELNIVHEFIADRKAIDNGDAHSFAMMLLNASYPTQSSMLANSFFHSPIKRRLLMLTTSKNARFTYLRRVAILPLLAVTFILFAFTINKVKKASAYPETNNSVSEANRTKELLTQNKDEVIIALADTTKKKATGKTNGIIENSGSVELISNEIPVVGTDKDSLNIGKALVVLDGKFITQEALNNTIKADDIKVVNVLKGEAATLKYGEKGKNGVIEVITKQDSAIAIMFKDSNNQEVEVRVSKVSIEAKKLSKELIVLDGKYLTWEDLDKIKGEGMKYSFFNVLKGEDATKKYGEKGENGVVEIKTFDSKEDYDNFKKNSKPSPTSPTSQNKDGASFNGGLEEWRKYFFRNTNFNALSQHKAPTGKYTVIVSFIVGKDGSISNALAETRTGFGTEEEAIRTISRGPNWKPAKRDGVFVDTRVKQTITYTVTKEGWSYVEINSIVVGNEKTTFIAS